MSEDMNGIDELRIIAQDTPGLKRADREAIVRAADELERAERCGATLFVKLREERQRNEALTDQLAALHRKHGHGEVLIFDTMSASVVAPMQPKSW